MFITHRVFLQWLLYVVVVSFIITTLTYFGIPQLVVLYDYAYLGTALFVMYALAEILAGRQAIMISKQNLDANRTADWLEKNGLRDIQLTKQGTVELVSNNENFIIPDKSVASIHLKNLIRRSGLVPKGSPLMSERLLLTSLADRTYFKVLIGDFVGSRITWVGILATVVGVIMALWPFVSKIGVDTETLRNNLGPFFQGVAVAFIPTAVSFVFKIALDFNSRILTSGANELLETVTEISEVYVLPVITHLKQE